jgi:predicted NUDIX family phosphoesterase
MKKELVLCIPTSILRKQFNLSLDFWKVDKTELDNLEYTYIQREEAEKNNLYKQLIPYVLIFDEEHKILCYQRHGSEKRLSNCFSIGWGGHVNNLDEGDNLYQSLVNCIEREIKEETGLSISSESLDLIGMINEEYSEVGHCHIGLVFKLSIDKQELCFSKEEIGKTVWTVPYHIDFSNFELWSKLALNLYNQIKE